MNKIGLLFILCNVLIINVLLAQTQILINGVLAKDTVNICAGDDLTLEASGAETYQWSPSVLVDMPTASTIVVSPNSTTMFTVVGTQTDSTTSADTILLVVDFELDIAAFIDEEAIDSTAFLTGCELQLQAVSSEQGLVYDWSNDDDLLGQASVYNEILNTTGAFTYTLTAESTIGCTQSIPFNFSVRQPLIPTDEENFIPNAFTPNGDGLNDTFEPYLEKGLALEEMKIYNRWGQCVYNHTSGNTGWDGTFDGEDAPADTYFYTLTIRLPEGEALPSYSSRGELTLLR